jgi:hypothetical protein
VKILSTFFITLILSSCVKLYEFEISSPCQKIMSNNPNEPIVTTVAGSGISGYKDGSSNEAKFSSLHDMAIDKEGNIYALDNSGIRKINKNGYVSTFVKKESISKLGSEYYSNIEIDNSNNIYLIYGSHSILKINPNGELTIFAGNPTINGDSDGKGTNARFYSIYDIVIDKEDNIFVTDRGNDRVRKINKSGEVTTLAGSDSSDLKDKTDLNSKIIRPQEIKIDSENNIILKDDFAIRKISNGVISTIKQLIVINELTKKRINVDEFNEYTKSIFGTNDDKGNNYYISNNRIKKMTSDGKISDFAGVGTGCIDGSVSKAKFNAPSKIIYNNGVLYILDLGSNRVRKIKI